MPLQAAHATTMARELLANGAAVTSMLGMLTSWEEPVRLSAVRALAKVCWQVCLQDLTLLHLTVLPGIHWSLFIES